MTLAELYGDRQAAAREWKRAGGKIVGVFGDDVPTALVEAAGFMAYRISGDPRGGQPAIMARGPLDVRADRFELPNSWVHLIARGRYDFVDHFVISNSRKYVLQLHERLAALDAPLSMHILDRALGSSEAARRYNTRQVLKLRTALEEWAAQPVTRDALAEAVGRRNALARLAGEAAELREGAKVRLAGIDALHLFGAMRFMHSRDAIAICSAAIAAAREAKPVEGPRLFVAGSPLDHDHVYREAEAAGFAIVGESHRWGGRSLEIGISGGEPFAAVADHYHRTADFVLPLSESIAEAVARFRRCGAGALLQYIWEHDEASLWEAPSERTAIGAPAACLSEQPYRFESGSLATALAPLAWEAA